MWKIYTLCLLMEKGTGNNKHVTYSQGDQILHD